MYFLKWTSDEGSGAYKSSFEYDMPTTTRIPNIHSTEKAISCYQGFHCSDLDNCYSWRGPQGNRLFIVEVFGKFDIGECTTKICFNNIRIIREVHGLFDEITTQLIGYNTQLIGYNIPNIREFAKKHMTIIDKLQNIDDDIFMDCRKITLEEIIEKLEEIKSEGLDLNLPRIFNNLISLRITKQRTTNILYEYIIKNRFIFNTSYRNKLPLMEILHIVDNVGAWAKPIKSEHKKTIKLPKLKIDKYAKLKKRK